MSTAIACTALLGLLIFGLGFLVSLTRGSTKTTIGHASDPTDRLHKVVRAHANTAEYAPMLAVMFLYLGSAHPATWVLWTMVIATLARYSIVAGLILGPTLDEPHPLRFMGALGTYLGGLALCVALALSI